MHKNHNEPKPLNCCPCGKECLCCLGEKLTVTSGSDMEAKQYEYKMEEKMRHQTHNESHEAGHEHHKMQEAGKNHDMSRMPARQSLGAGGSHIDHEAAMTNPAMAKEMEKDMRRRFWVAFILSIPVFLYSPVAGFLKINLPSPIPVNWLLFILTTPIVFWTGSIFITGTYYSLKSRKLNMSVLIATGVLAAYLFSVFITLAPSFAKAMEGKSETFYEAAALLVTFVLFGHWMEMKSRRGTSDALRALFDLVPPQANVVRGGKEIVLPVAEVVVGDIIVARPGDKIPVDGEIIEGETAIDESLVTGESLPVEKNVGNKVIGGSINQSGQIKFRAQKVGSDTALAQIIKMVEKAQNSKAPGQRIADKAAAWLVVLAVVSGLLTFAGWYFIGGTTALVALTFAISAVVIACPDALGLATPTAVAVGTGIGAKHNILIKDAATLENTSKLNAILLDKTGTLTEGRPKVTDVIAFNGFNERDVLLYEASIEVSSNHPLAKAIVEEAKSRGIAQFEAVEKFESVAGYGLRARIGGREILAGKEKLLVDGNIVVKEARSALDRLAGEGKTLSLLVIDGKLAGIVAAADTVKSSAKKAVDNLKKLGMETVMITGDHQKVARAVGKELGIERIFAEVLPEDKAIYVKKLQDEGRFVAMVGDGINDAPALAQADIGIAIGAGTDVAIETASVVLMKSDPYDIVRAIALSKATVAKMKQNLFWAAIYNILAIPVAAGVFYNSFGISLRPEISALLMSASSIIVATNAVLLKRVESQLV